MKKSNILMLAYALSACSASFSADDHVSGKITSLKGSATEPAIRIEGNISPNNCDGGNWGWLHFQGTPEERQWIYATAMAMAVTGNPVTVYTNIDGTTCRINDIQVTSGF